MHRKGVDERRFVESTYCFFRDAVMAFEPDDDEEDEDDDLMNDELPEIEVPTLVLSGRHSTVMGAGARRTTAAEKLPRGRQIEL